MNYEPTLRQDGQQRGKAQQLSQKHDSPPTDVPGYVTEHFIGAGAYGEVWKAKDTNTEREVAIKFYSHRGGLDWSLLSREVEKLRFLFADRYIVQLLDVGWEAEPPYYVMEYMEAGALEECLRDGPLPVDQALTLFREIAIGLRHAHDKGVLHCDLKPANVLLDQDGKPRLADFGQSRLSHEQTPALGTLFYMAPEQASLDAVPNAAWDVYALGALFYCILTGAPPHRTTDSDTLLEESSSLEERLERYRKLIQESPAPCEHRRLSGMDRHLAEIVDRCLASDPKKRFANVQAVLDALERRRLRRAQLPLLVLGVGAPILLLTVISIFAYNGFSTALSQSEEAVIGRALESNRFAAQFVAENVAGQISHRWQLLEQAANRHEMQRLLVEAYRQPRGSPPREALQAALTGLREGHPDISATSWFVTDRDGRQLARYPQGKTIDQVYSYRDYFHGQGRDLEPGTKDIKPIQDVHRSIVFRSKATKRRMVAFSVPVFSEHRDGETPSVIGVLAMTVELGTFAELRPEYGSSAAQFAVLVDSQEDWHGRRGAVLEHPELARHMRGNSGPLPEVYLAPKEIATLAELRPLKLEVLQETERGRPHPVSREPGTVVVGSDSENQFNVDDISAKREDGGKTALDSGTRPAQESPSNPIRLKNSDVGNARLSESDQSRSDRLRELAVRTNYIDPVGGAFQGRWLAAIEPVIVVDRPPAIGDTGWAVIVQERYADASRPVWELAPQLKQMGLIALTVVGMLVMMLWGFVMIVLNDGPHSQALAGIRRRIGLSSLRGSSDRTTPNRSTETRHDATVAYETAKKE